MEKPGAGLDVGELCFAHVKGYPWWPARVVAKKKRKSGISKQFSVLFFGTKETADLSSKDLVCFSPSSVAKYVTNAAMKRKYFEEGFKEIVEESERVLQNSSEEFDTEVEDNTFPINKEDFLAAFNLKISGPSENVESEVSASVTLPSTNDITECTNPDPDNDTMEHLDDDDEFSTEYDLSPQKVVMFSDTAPCKCKFCGKTFRSEAHMEKHAYLAHKEEYSSDDSDPFVEDLQVKQKKSPVISAKSIPRSKVLKDDAPKKSKSKNPNRSGTRQSKLVKTLQEDERENDKLFVEKIEMRDIYFFCKSCNFSTTTKMRAKTHAVSCGKTKKKVLSKKIISCLECDQTFSSKKELGIHNREHATQGYTCSTCLKVMFRRNSYLKHIRSHREPPKLECTLCSKVFRFNCDLKRHIETHTKQKKDNIESYNCKKVSDDMVNFEIDLEERRVGGDYWGVLSVKELAKSDQCYSKNYTTFQSSSGLNCREIWDLNVETSNLLGTPLAIDESKPAGTVEICIYTNEKGETVTKFAWNSFQTLQQYALEIVLDMVKDAVQLGTLRDPTVPVDEIMEVVTDTLKDIVGGDEKYEELLRKYSGQDTFENESSSVDRINEIPTDNVEDSGVGEGFTGEVSEDLDGEESAAWCSVFPGRI